MSESGSLFQPIGAAADHVECDVPASSQAEDGTGGAPSTQLAAGDMMALKSLCMNCHEAGVTNLLLITIPFFRNVIIMAFECEHCGLRNSEVQAAEIQEKGCRFEVKIESKRVGRDYVSDARVGSDSHENFPQDLNRQLVKSDRASVRIPELDFEIPAATQRGVFTVNPRSWANPTRLSLQRPLSHASSDCRGLARPRN